MALSGPRVLWLTLAAALALPGAAHAACAQTTLLDEEQRAQLILVAQALPGDTAPDGTLLSPARFRVLRYDKGRGSTRVRVTTATRRITLPDGRPGYVSESEGFRARPGVTYRILGRRSGGVIRTSTCDGTDAAPRRPPRLTARVGVGGGARRLPPSDVDGRRTRRRPPRIGAEPGDVIALGPGFVGAETVITRAGAFRPFGTRFGNGWRLPRRLGARTRLVVHTGRALYAFTVVRR